MLKYFLLFVLAELETDEEAGKTGQNFLKSAMQKTAHTLELFDEDANTEPPSMSQNSNNDIGIPSSAAWQNALLFPIQSLVTDRNRVFPTEMSERPFEQPSGETAKRPGVSPGNSPSVSPGNSCPATEDTTDLQSIDNETGLISANTGLISASISEACTEESKLADRGGGSVLASGVLRRSALCHGS